MYRKDKGEKKTKVGKCNPIGLYMGAEKCFDNLKTQSLRFLISFVREGRENYTK